MMLCSSTSLFACYEVGDNRIHFLREVVVNRIWISIPNWARFPPFQIGMLKTRFTSPDLSCQFPLTSMEEAGLYFEFILGEQLPDPIKMSYHHKMSSMQLQFLVFAVIIRGPERTCINYI